MLQFTVVHVFPYCYTYCSNFQLVPFIHYNTDKSHWCHVDALLSFILQANFSPASCSAIYINSTSMGLLKINRLIITGVSCSTWQLEPITPSYSPWGYIVPWRVIMQAYVQMSNWSKASEASPVQLLTQGTQLTTDSQKLIWSQKCTFSTPEKNIVWKYTI